MQKLLHSNIKSKFEFIPSSANIHCKSEDEKGKNTIAKLFHTHKKGFHIDRAGSTDGFTSKKYVILLSGRRAGEP